MNIQNSVFYVGGSKGGVGKSLFSFALVDYLLNRNANVLLVAINPALVVAFNL